MCCKQNTSVPVSTVAHCLIKNDHLSKLNLCDLVSGLLAFAFFFSVWGMRINSVLVLLITWFHFGL